MGMFDWVRCEHPLPDGFDGTDVRFQTKDLDSVLMDWTLTADGRLIAHRTRLEVVPDEERPFFGTQAWKAGGLARFFGSLRAVPEGDAEVAFRGDIRFYVCTPVGAESAEAAERPAPAYETRCYTARFTNGRLEWICGGLESGR